MCKLLVINSYIPSEFTQVQRTISGLVYDCGILSVLVIEILQSWTDTTLCGDHFGYRLIQWAHTQNDLCFETYSPYLSAAIWVCFLNVHLSEQRLKLYFILQDAW